MSTSPWLVWTRRIQAIAQTGFAFTQNPYDRDRYAALHRLATQMMAGLSGGEPKRVEDLFRHAQGYATPKVDVRAAIFRGDDILLVRETTDDGWSLPGGWADVDEPPRAMVIREVREEAGLDVIVSKLAAVYHRGSHPHPPYPFDVYRLFFICESVGGELRPGGIETSEVRYFAENALPSLSTLRVLDYQIKRMFDHRRSPDLPTDCD